MFSKSCQYAIRAVAYLAEHKGTDKNAGVKEIAEALQVPQQFLAKILQTLSRHNLISSVKGPGGGFYLDETNVNAPLLEIVEVIDGKNTLNACILGKPTCSSEHPCLLHQHFHGCREGLRSALSTCTIGSLMDGKSC
ncbi:MAG: Rrf2 family transcriptional regulator [Saprospiraceae bacterium]|nr:Rrf2 family transcriptional regulator [Saprospiraceae bacterium]MCF8249178.1 Rrf2 family transcriptional regulator [Saprospiraceae bacterium]MCF8281822.1 Rrf2 family transcriptional regulator [Bacteroidales bacterium]MCF8311307.1 Rrf2 family transcriptional regulator [Saprospiraceae bacterium]MCF8440129.1 Rrf2 family transcriptional regulator [Saprospiraceae bacterium]